MTVNKINFNYAEEKKLLLVASEYGIVKESSSVVVWQLMHGHLLHQNINNTITHALSYVNNLILSKRMGIFFMNCTGDIHTHEHEYERVPFHSFLLCSLANSIKNNFQWQHHIKSDR